MFTHHSIKSLRATLALVERKEELERQIQGINQQLSRAISGRTASPSTGRPSKGPKVAKVSRGKRVKRGALKELILSALNEAGDAGIAVQHLAKKIGAKPVNVHAWFASTGKKGGLTEAVGRGIYRLKR